MAKVKLPGIGEVPRWSVFASLGLVGVVGFVYIRNRRAAAANASTSTGGMVTDPDGNQCASLAASGYCPGTPGDMNAGGYGYGGYDANAGFGGSPYGNYQGTGCFDAIGNPIPCQDVQSPVTQIVTFAEWVQASAAYLQGTGANENTFLAAAGNAQAHRCLNPDQYLLWNEAEAAIQPPSSGMPIANPCPNGGGRGGKKVKVPSEIGKQYMTAAISLRAAGLIPHRGEPNVGKVTSQHPSPGDMVDKGSTVTLSGRGNTIGQGFGPINFDPHKRKKCFDIHGVQIPC